MWTPGGSFGETKGGNAGGHHNLIMCSSHTELPEKDATAFLEQRVP